MYKINEMEKILDRENWDWDFEFYPPDTFNDGEYILSKYAILERVEDGFLLFHTIFLHLYYNLIILYLIVFFNIN